MSDMRKVYPFGIRCVRISTILLCIVGFMLSFYAYHVETNAEKDPKYRAMCDISAHVSCTTVFSSKYGKGFGLLDNVADKNSIIIQPNSIYGIIFYVMFALLGELSNRTVAKSLILAAAVSNICSVYLAYILYFILHDFCIVCVSTYVVNFGLLICSIYKYKMNEKIAGKKEV